MSERHVIKIAVSPEANRQIEKLCERYGMSKLEAASRMYAWLAGQDQIVQASVLGLLPDSIEGEAADIYMEQVKAKRASGVKSSPRKGPK